MKKVIKLTTLAAAGGLLLSSAASFAATPGLYLGAQGGYANLDLGNYDSKIHDGQNDLKDAVSQLNNTNLSYSDSSDKGGFGGRAYVGYMFNKYFGLESGFTYLPRNKYSVSASTSSSIPVTVEGVQHTLAGAASLNDSVRSYAFDLVGKASYPVTENFDVYAKAGVAHLTTKNEVSGSINNLTLDGAPVAGGSASISETNNAFAPTFGGGVAYSFNKNLAMDVSYTRIQGRSWHYHSPDLSQLTSTQAAKSFVGSNLSLVPSTNLAAVGLTYTFDNLG